MHLIPTVLFTLFGALVLFLAGSVAGKRVISRGGRIALLFLGLTLASPAFLFALYYVHVLDNAAWFYTLRALPATELLGSGLGFVAGTLNSWLAPQTFGEKIFVPVSALMFVLIPFIKPLLDPIDLSRLRDRCEGDVCLQSTFSTCGPCSAATLLKAFGQTASEKELASECRTTRGGTEIWYIARAFERRGYHTRVLIQKPQNLSSPSPSIAGVNASRRRWALHRARQRELRIRHDRRPDERQTGRAERGPAELLPLHRVLPDDRSQIQLAFCASRPPAYAACFFSSHSR